MSNWHPKTKFPEYLKDSSSKDRQEYFSETFLLEHEILIECRHRTRQCLFKPSLYPILNVVGPTGAGKTALAKNVVTYCFEEALERGITTGLPAVYVEVPMLGGNSFNWKDLFLRILSAMKSPANELHRKTEVSEEYALGGKYSNSYRSEGEVRKDLEQRMLDSHLKILVLDEIQHLFKYSGQSSDKNLDILKNIANTVNCQMILIGTYENLAMMNWNAQLKRRTEEVHFRRYLWKGKDKKDFARTYSGLLSHVPYKMDKGLFESNFIQKMYIYCCGCIGVLKQIIEKSIDELPEDDSLTVKRLLSTVPNTNTLLEMAEEIEYGEDFFTDKGLDAIGKLLGVGTSKKKRAKEPEEKKSAKNQRPGTRKPERDLVT